MPMQSGTPGSGQYPGLSVKAWALVSGGVVLAGSNIATATNPNGVSNNISFTFTAALPNANYIVDAKNISSFSGGPIFMGCNSKTAAGFQLTQYNASGGTFSAYTMSASDTTYVAVYG